MKLSIVVPCYNESKNIPLILEKFSSVIKRDDVEVLLVNNGSKDSSQEILDMLIPKYSFARVVIVKENEGYGFGIASGLLEAKGEFIGYTFDQYEGVELQKSVLKKAGLKKYFPKWQKQQ